MHIERPLCVAAFAFVWPFRLAAFFGIERENLERQLQVANNFAIFSLIGIWIMPDKQLYIHVYTHRGTHTQRLAKRNCSQRCAVRWHSICIFNAVEWLANGATLRPSPSLHPPSLPFWRIKLWAALHLFFSPLAITALRVTFPSAPFSVKTPIKNAHQIKLATNKAHFACLAHYMHWLP